ncbi:hypothetical protein MMC20_006939 [Loxospora ochrophaea]|nr:hypothetical protein [Loxospora ochrophaea]
MVAMYTVAGRQLSIATLSITGLVAAVAMRGGEKAKEKGPPINASSKDEEAFIQEFIKNANAEEQKAKH